MTVVVLLMILMMAGHASAQVLVKGNVYGGGNLADVGQSVTVNIKAGEVDGDVYGGGALANTNTDNWDSSANDGAGGWAADKTSATNITAVNLTGGTIKGDAYGGGLGRLESGTPNTEGYLEAKPATEYGDVTVTVNGTQIGTGAGRVFGANNINGTPKGHVKVLVLKTKAIEGQATDVAAVFGGGNQAAYNPYSSTEKAEVEINKTPADGRLIVGYVFGGGNEAGMENTASTDVKIITGDVKTGVYGGCNTSGTVSGDTKVVITGGTIGTAWENAPATFPTLVFGGGLGSETLVSGSVTLELGAMTAAVAPATDPTISGNATIWGDVYGGSAKGIVNAEWTGNPAALSPTAGKTTSVAFYSGIVKGNLYGGGLGDATHAADVYGNITVNIGTGTVNASGFATAFYGNATINGSVYGCNNTKGTPKGDVTVNIWKTAHTDANAYPTENDNTDSDTEVNTLSELAALIAHPESNDYLSKFAIAAVYGGGNQAAYDPIVKTGENANRTTVHVYACENNTIQTVYGGGNAANATNVGVIIDGGFFDRVFGGGNGYSVTGNHTEPSEPNYNPGADISGSATTQIHGGLFRQLFGGSNQYGDVKNANLSIDNASECRELIGESFGGANQANITGNVTTTLTCSGNMEVANFYGGSNEADIDGSVTLNVYGGHFVNVFGGSKGVADDPETQDDESISADITGNVTLNLYGGTIEENAYGGSNINGSIGGKITVNVLNNNGTCNLSIGGDIYGAGNETPYAPTYTPDSGSERISPIVNLIHGTVANVFGGAKGETATVIASPQVNIGYDATTMETLLTELTQDTDNYKSATATAPADFSAVVNNNVYGGGNLAQVAGSTTVNLRKANSSIGGSLFGGGNAASVGNATVNVIDGSVSDGVYGGCNTSGSVGGTINNNAYDGNIAVNVTGGTVGAGSVNAETGVITYTTKANVHGGGYGQATSTTGNVAVTVNGASAVIWGDVYGGSALGNVNNDATDATTVTLTAGAIHGNLYGGGLGRNAMADNPETSDVDESVSAVAALVNGAVTVTVNGGTVSNVFGCNNENGSPQNGVTVNINNSVPGSVYGGGNLAAYNPTSHSGAYPAVNINNGTVGGDVFGGGLGASAKVYSNPVVTVGDVAVGHESYAAVITGSVYGGGSAAMVGDDAQATASTNNTTVLVQKANSSVTNVFGGGMAAGVTGATNVTIANGTVSTAVFGGCNTSGTVGGTSTVTVTAGTIGTAFTTTAPTAPNPIPNVLFGGGKGSATSVTGQVTLNVGTKDGSTYMGSANIHGNVYGGSENGEVHAVDVYLYGNTIYGNVFGGGYSTAENKTAATAVNVVLDGTKFDRTYDGTAQIFGCNNLVGTPLGQVNVHVFRTAATDGYTGTYHVAAVYGGGNEADYVPTASDVGNTQVIIEGCDKTSIDNVYGGGNAAAVPGTEVWILGSTIINNVYGGGNGELGAAYAAHVGYHRDSETTKHEYTSGTGKSEVFLVAGTIHDVYGGSNSNGNIRVGADVKTATQSNYTTKFTSAPTPDCCSKLKTDHIYGGGSQAEMEGDAKVILECMPEDFVAEVYGGAQNANVNGSVELTVTSGKFGRVFGGNNTGGNINGSITVNVYEDGCKPLIIGELYGAGNNAPYSIYGLAQNGTPNTSGESELEGTDAVSVNVYSCTSIGKVYGGGKGATAKVVGNIHVWINMLNGIINGTPKTKVGNPDDYIGKIGQVFGGGSAADVIGSTTIDIGTATVHPNNENKELIGVNIVSGNYLNPMSDAMNNSVTAGIYGGGEAADVEGNTTLNIGTKDLSEGTNITGDIFGGGLGETTHVTGDVRVNIGGQDATTGDYVGYATITGDVYGGSAKGKVNSKLVSSVETPQTGKTTQVNFYGGAITGNVYGGGLGVAQVGEVGDQDYAAAIPADVYGPVAVNVYGGTANNVFGCNNVNGAPQSTVTVTMNGGTINNSVYGGGNQAAYSVENNPTKDQANAYKKYPVVNINNGTITGNVFGGGLGLTATVTGSPQVTIGDNVGAHAVTIGKSVYGGGELAGVDYDTNIRVLKGAVGDATGVNAGETYGNVYGAGMGNLSNVEAGIVKGNTNITISGGNIYHNIYGGGAYGSVGTITRGAATYVPGKASVTNMPTSWVRTEGSETGKATITITGGTIGINGHENGMVFGSSRGNVATPEGDPAVDPNDRLAWVYETEVVIGTLGSEGPTIKGSVYGSGENGHVYYDTDVKIHSGIIGITDTTIDGGAAFNRRGNVYGGGCGEDTYKVGNVDTYNPLAGIVLHTANVTIDGGHVVHNVYGAGALGSVGTMTTDNNGKITITDGSGTTTIAISGGIIGDDGTNSDGNIFGAARGDVNTTQTGVALVKTTDVTISGNADVKGNVYGGGEIGDVQGNAAVAVQGGSIAKNVFGGGKGDGGLFDCSKAMVGINNEGAGANPGTGGNENKGTKVTISNGTIGTLNNGTLVENTGNVYGGGEIGRVEWNTQVEIGVGDGEGTFEPYIYGNVFGAGKGLKTHGYSALVRGNSTVTVQGDAKIGKDVYGGGEIATVGRYWVKNINNRVNGVVIEAARPEPEDLPDGMPYKQQSGGICRVTIQGNAEIGYNGVADDAGHVFGAGKGVDSPYVSSGLNNSQKMTDDQGLVDFVDGGGKTAEQLYYEFLETLALVTNSFVTVDESAKVKGNVYGGSESGFVQHDTNVTIQGGTIGTSGSTTYGNVFGGGKGLPTFAEAGKVKGATNVAISGGTTNGNVYGGGQLGYVQQNVAVTVSGGQVVNDVYGGGALANTNTDNWDTKGSAVEYVLLTVKTNPTDEELAAGVLKAGTTAIAGYYTRSGESAPYTYTIITGTVTAAADGKYYKKKVVGGWATDKNTSNATTYKTTVDLTGGIVGNAYGGGLGDATHAANVYGDVEVTVNDPTKVTATSGNLVAFTKESESFTIGTTGYSVDVTGHVFGCNNINGTPTGHVTVHVFKTKYIDKNGVIHTDYHVPVGDDTETFEIQGVYGGGNQADYLPADGKKTSVIIEGCQITSIKKVYGGGNSASVPATDVDIESSYFIGYAFGGGNGGEHVKKSDGWHENEGAIVIGLASIACKGGKVGSVFGGSDAKGTCGGVSIDTSTENADCPRIITRLYGAGNEADITGDVNMILSSCSDNNDKVNEIEYVHGGSYNANVTGDVTLTITSGIFKNVYGGNDARGSIGGDITVNIEETDNCPIIIQNLVGGGNNAPYPGIKRDGTEVTEMIGEQEVKRHGKITVNVKSATRIDNVYGGCFNAEAYADTEVNINMLKGNMAGATGVSIPERYKNLPNIENVGIPSNGYVTCTIKNEIGTIGNVFGGGNEGLVKGTSTVNIGTATTVDIMKRNGEGKILDIHDNVITFKSGEMLAQGIQIGYVPTTVIGANITSDVYGGGNKAEVTRKTDVDTETGNTYVNICSNKQPKLDANNQLTGAYTYTLVDAVVAAGVKIGGSVYGGGCEADVKGNTFVGMSGGYVFNGIFGGGYSGSVGTFTRSDAVAHTNVYGHETHTGCIGKPISCATGTGKCSVVVNGGQIGPVDVAKDGMNAAGGPNPHGWVWGGGCGLIENPSDNPDTHFQTYVGSTDVTIGGTAFIMESIIGGGEFGRVLGNTLVKIEGGQIGVGNGKWETVDGIEKPIRYTDAQFIDPTTTIVTGGVDGNALAECSHFPYGNNNHEYLPYDPYYETYSSYVSSHTDLGPASTSNPSDGKTWIGCVFGGGSGYMPYLIKNNSNNPVGYDWCRSAGWVEGNTEVIITGGHILTNVYGANEYTDVKGQSIVRMTGGTIGVPRTLAQIAEHPLTCYLFGAGKGDERSHFYNYTNVGSVVVDVSGGIIYGSVFGGSEDGHVLGDVSVTIRKGDNFTIGNKTYTDGPIIGTWGTSYVDGNVFGGGRGFSGTTLTAGNVGGNVTMNIQGGTMLGSIYGGGRLGSVGYDLVKAKLDGGSDNPAYGTMQDGNSHGHVTINISGGTIGNNHEFAYTPTPANVPNTLYEEGKLMHTKGGNVFAGGMGRRTKLDNVTPITNWQKLGNVKSTKLNISGTAWIKGNVYGGGEFGAVTGSHAVVENSTPVNDAEGQPISAGTEIVISGGVVGTMMEQGKAGSAVSSAYTGSGDNRYTFGSIYGGGYGTEVEVEDDPSTTEVNEAKPYETDVEKFGAYVNTNTYIKMSGSDTKVRASVYGGGEMACVKGNTYVNVVNGDIGIGEVRVTAGSTKDYVLFGSWKMGNVYGAGKGSTKAVRSGLVMGNTNVNISNGNIYHNVYGGGAYGSVGIFTMTSAAPAPTEWTSGGKATVKITGGTIGINGWDNGMVSGSGRGDVSAAAGSDPYDKLAWVNNTEVTIGNANGTGPTIKGSVYGGGENGHNYANAVVNVHGGTIGVVESDGLTITSRGNVYGAGCGTDTYTDNGKKYHNAMAGNVQGDTYVTIDGGQVVRNVYGGGSMGSVGTMTREMTTDETIITTITRGGTTNITVSGGTIGEDGNDNGNVFGAARGDEVIAQAGAAVVKTTNVTISQGENSTTIIKGSVYGGGEIGDVGTYSTLGDGTKTYLGGSGACFVNVTGGTVRGNVFGAGKGSDKTFQCEKAMVKDANVSVSNGIIGTLDNGNLVEGTGNVYGGGEVGRVENDTKVTIGRKTDETEGNGTGTPDIKGSVFGGGKGVATHGYSALTRGNAEVTVEGGANAKVGKNVYGGGEIASVGRYGLNDEKKPDILLDGGKCEVKVLGNVVIGPTNATDQEGNVFGAGKGIDPQTFVLGTSRRMVSYDSSRYTDSNKNVNNQLYWEFSDDTHDFVWEYFINDGTNTGEENYNSYLETLALTTEPDVTIDGNATVNGSVFGGGELGLTKGSITVTIKGGTMKKDVYGGGALANTNTTKTIGVKQPDGSYQKDGKYVTTTYFATTNVYLQGGLVYGDAYGGGLGQIGVHFTQEEITAAQSGDPAYGKTTNDWKVEPIDAKTFGEINVCLGGNKEAASASATAFNTSYLTDDKSNQVVNSGRVFGCNNRNGSPQENVTVTVWKTVAGKLNGGGVLARTPSNKKALKEGDAGYVPHTYEVAAVYGGGNLASFTASNQSKKTHVIIHGCNDTSIEMVYGGGNAAAVPETSIDVYGCYEIGSVFGGGNGKDKYTLDGGSSWAENPGANVIGNGNDIKGNTTTWLYGGMIHEAYGGSHKKGTITGSVFIDVGDATAAVAEGLVESCLLEVGKIVGAGKNADVDKDVILVMGCKPDTYIPLVYGGADNANVKGNVELTITSGNFGKVFGGNNLGGAIKGHIKLNIEETGNCEMPITIEELYLGGNEAAYSKYGYYEVVKTDNNGNPVLDENDEPIKILLPRTAEIHAITNTSDANYKAPHDNPAPDATHTFPYAEPELNIISCTSIGQVFGGGYGEDAAMYANPTVNINMIPGSHANKLGGLHKLGAVGSGYQDKQNKWHEGGVFGGGNEATVYGNTTVNIGTANEVYLVNPDIETGDNVTAGYYEYKNGSYTLLSENTTAENGVYYYLKKTVEGANIVSNVYGGGNLADVTGNTYVNICAVNNNAVTISGSDANGTYEGVTINGNVFGGGKGIADSFMCAKGMVGKNDEGKNEQNPGSIDKGTRVNIGNGTINGNVYGGGEIGRVEWNTLVKIGLGNGTENGTLSPVIEGSVFGAGKGLNTHGYSALVRGDTEVTVKGNAWVKKSVYGGGEIASVGRYKVKKGDNDPVGAPADVEVGMPYKTNQGGNCTVIVQGYAEIGPNGMQMAKADGNPDDTGYVFGGGKGVLPYEALGETSVPEEIADLPRRITTDETTGDYWEYYTEEWYNAHPDDERGTDYEGNYLKYIETLALTTNTDVTVSGNAFVKGSVYGGSENGHVQGNTHVVIDGDCQIGCGKNTTARHPAAVWGDNYTPSVDLECASWPYGNKIGGTDANPIMEYLPYDVYKTHKVGNNDVVDWASDGHTFYGNVFGGGSGLYPYMQNPEWETKKDELGGKSLKDLGYSDGIWLRSAGAVYGDTHVEIKGGHILTNVYGGNECTDVNGEAKVEMSGGTLGVPRTVEQIKAHPVTCYLFGAGKGDQRINFNTWTNVKKAIVNITGGRIYGSVFGGGEDGHVLEDVEMTIGQAADKTTLIGMTGTSYVDGNVFGGGRGFSGDAQTAGTVGGNVTLTISGGTMLGSVYGGGRLASVGTQFTAVENPDYGNFKEDGDGKTYGHVTINISGGTIGNNVGNAESGNVFGGSMGRLTLLNGEKNPIWPKMAQVKTSTINISGDNTVIKRNVYGGGELGTVRDNAYVTIGGTLGADKTTVTPSGSPTIRRDVYGGGYGSKDMSYTILTVKELESDNQYHDHTYAFKPMQFAGCVGKNTYVNIAGGYVVKSVYGGGELASVGVINFRAAELTSGTSTVGKVYFHDAVSDKDYYYTNMIKHDDATKEFALSWPYEFEYVEGYPGATHVKVTGGRLGLKSTEPQEVKDSYTDNGDVYGAGKGQAGDYNDYLFCANVGSTDVKIDHSSSNELTEYHGTNDLIAGAVYGGGEDGHVMGNTKVTIEKGFVYHSVYGGGSGKGQFPATVLKIGATEEAPEYDTRDIYSISAGKVFGNTEIEMNGGHVVRNVYGGGNMGSVGKGNYAGGTDDYSTAGYGENAGGSLWNSSTEGDNAWQFLHSGKCTVKITGGTIGYIDESNPSNSMYPRNSSASLPYGNVFGGCRGESAPNISESPRYLYSPEFFIGYANETDVTIGKADGSSGPTILGSVYGGGMDGHVRRDTHVEIKAGEIGLAYNATNQGTLGSDPNNIQWLARGNVYGAGSGIGKYKYDFNYNKKTSTDTNENGTIEDNEVEVSTYHGNPIKEEDYSSSAGSVTRFTKVEVKGGTIHRNVYGGGSLATVGAPKMGQSYYPYHPDDTDTNNGEGKQSLNEVKISGGHIGDATSVAAGYGGNVFGASRGDVALDATSFSSAIYSDVAISQTSESVPTVIEGNVYGGGELGNVKANTTVAMQGGTIVKNVFGGGKGDGGLFDCSKAMVGIEGEGAGADLTTKENKAKGTSVTISNGTVNGNVYGGGEVGRVEWNTQVKIGVGTGDGPFAPVIEGSVFGAGKGLETHGYSALVRGNSTVTVQGAAKIGHNVYGGGEMATVGRYWVKGRNTTDPNTGQPFDDATPIPEDLPDGMPYKQQSGGYCNVTIQGNAIIGPKENLAPASETAGHVFGAGQGVVPHFSDGPKRKVNDGDPVAFAEDTERGKTAEEVYNEFLETLALVTNANVTIDGSAQVKGNVYGGSESGFVQHHTNVKVQNGTIGMDGSYGNVFGGGKGLSLSSTSFTEAGKVKENTRVDILGGTMYGDVYGGGALGKSNTAVDNNGTYPTATVNLKGGIITGSAYGGGLGDANTKANVGNTILHLNEGVVTTTKGCIVKGYIFGANNVNGTPLGHALVHIHATQNVDKTDLKTKYPIAEDNVNNKYDVKGVFGGGNASDYVPASTDAKQSTEVIIDGCDLTSIEDVYGGGYGAAVPATDVLIRGTHIINNVFGGGYGAGSDDPEDDDYNPGANVGYRTDRTLSYGETVTGKTNVKLMAGRIHHVYGASNTQGDIRGGSSITTVEKPDEINCNLIVDDIFGGGNEAPMVGGTEVVLGCMPGDWIEEVYAGSQSADVGAGAVGADVSLTITSGKFGRVFGGNKSSGIINGGIEVHIEENPDCDTPIIIGELYAGGNMAPYSAYGYANDGTLLREGESGAHKASPVAVHAKAFTSIGKIFGGGKGSAARLIGNPLVLVDEVESEKTYEGDNTTTTLENGLIKKTLSDDTEVTLYPRTSTGTMGVVGTIFGGGNEALVEGSTTVKIATNEYVVFWSAPTLEDVRGFYTRTGEGTQVSPYVYTEVKNTDGSNDPIAPAAGTIYYKKVQGADIRGNVYGGGNNAEVTGDTNVVIGRKE